MPVQGPQQPGFFLPGAEYLSLAPNATIALQGRRHVATISPVTTIPADSLATPVTMAIDIETGFPPGAAIYLHNATVTVSPADAGLTLEIVALQMGLRVSNAGFGYLLGQPLLTLTSISVPGAIALSDRDKLITQRDIQAFDAAQLQPALPLTFVSQITFKNNDTTNSHNVQISGQIVYTRLDGLQE